MELICKGKKDAEGGKLMIGRIVVGNVVPLH